MDAASGGHSGEARRSSCGDCLRKDLKRRVRDIGDARIEIDEAPQEGVVEARRLETSRRALVLGALGALACIVTALVVWFAASSDAPAPLPVTRTVIPLPLGTELACCFERMIAISPDGRTTAYVVQDSRRA